MTRRPLLLVLLMAMLLQAVSLGGHWAGRGSAGEGLHDLLHWADISHHHEHQPRLSAEDLRAFESLEDGLGLASTSPHEGYHQDLSADSSRHMALDACLSTLGPLPAGIVSPAIRAVCPAPDARPEAPPADPDLMGLRRPPRSFA